VEREYLEGLKLDNDTIDKIMAEHDKDIDGLKQQVDTLEAEKESLAGQLGEANRQIEDFRGMDIEGIKQAADDWKTKAEAAEAKAKADVEKLQFDYALNAALTGARARDTRAVTALLDMEGLKLNNGEIVGLKDQLERLKAEKEFLFEGEGIPRIVKGTNNNADTGGTDALRAAMGLGKKE
jgi:hypothetical protein